MNFEAIKSGFLSYLEEKIGEKDQNITQNAIQNSEISIFLYSNEFKDYLVEEIGADVSIFSKSINDIMSMEIVDGKLVETDEEQGPSDTFEKEQTDEDNDDINNSNYFKDALNDILSNEMVINTLDVDKSGGLDDKEINSFLTGVASADENGEITFDNLAKSVQSIQEGNYIQPNTEGETTLVESGDNILNRLLDKVYNNKTAIKALDIDGDGKLNDEERAKFEEYIKGYDGNSDELTEADIKRAFDDIMDGKFSYDNDLTKIAEEIDKETEEELEERTQETQGTTPTGGTSGTSSGGSISSGGTAGSRNSFSSSNTNEPKTIENMTLEELESEKQTREADVKQAQEDVNAVHSGENEAVKNAKTEYEDAKEAYDEAVENDENISDETKEKRETNLQQIEEKEGEIDNLNIQINDQENLISEQESIIDADKSNISALKSALSALPSESEYSDDPDKQAEISNKKAEINAALEEAEAKLTEDEEKLKELNNDLKTFEDNLETAEGELEELEAERSEIEEEILENCSPETKAALEAFNTAKDNVDKVKSEELEKAQSALTDAQSALEEVNTKINEKKAEQTEKEYSVSEFDFDFELTLSDRQANELELFKQNWEENKERYQEVEDATGMPAELVAAIHWRESSGNFDTYLHNGQKLGQTTTLVPAGIYFEDWTEAAIDAVKNYGSDLSSIDPNDIQTYYDYAEHYNGMGYANKGLPSPYVWAGTSNYEKGKYVADGQFDPNYVDQQLGVAVMLQALLS